MSPAINYAPPIISVDVEDWAQSTWDRNLPVTNRAAENTRRLLHVLGEARVFATMFVLGKFAEAFPEVVREIHRQGHEVASHGYGHVEIFKQGKADFELDVRRSKEILEQIIGAPVHGYRAPDFSIVRRTLWALEVLADAGYQYDSSIFPVHRSRYGIPEWPTRPVRVWMGPDKSILEFPIATIRYLGNNWPVGGGGYHRLLPGFVTRHLAERAMSSDLFTLYCHPYELDCSEFKQIPFRVPFQVRFHQGFGRRWFVKRLRAFLDRFGGQRIEDLLASTTWPIFDPMILRTHAESAKYVF